MLTHETPESQQISSPESIKKEARKRMQNILATIRARILDREITDLSPNRLTLPQFIPTQEEIAEVNEMLTEAFDQNETEKNNS